MNERIRELYKNVLASSENMRWNIEDTEKFAELIVRECVTVADHSNVNGKSIIGERIKEHFGVK